MTTDLYADKGVSDESTLRVTLQRGRDTHTLLRLPRWMARAVRSALLVAIALAGAGVALHSVLLALGKMYVFPFWDMATVQYNYFNADWIGFILQRDNEHLPFLAMPLFAADNAFFAGRGVSLVVLILLSTGAMAALLMAEVKRCWGRADLALAAVGGVTVAVLFWLIHYENLVWPKQIHMYLSAVFSLLGARCAIGLDERLRWGGPSAGRAEMAGAAGLGLLLTAATFSFGYGMVGWIAVLVLVISGRWAWRPLGVLLAFFALTCLIYAVRYNYATLEYHANPASSIAHPLRLAWYCVHYLAYPVFALLASLFARETALTMGLALSVAGLAAAALFLIRVLLLRRTQASRAELLVAFLLLFSVGTGLLTGLSRLNFGVDQGLASRYAIVQVWFWLGLGIAAVAPLWDRVWLRSAGVAVVGGMVMALLVPSQSGYATITRDNLRTHWQSVLAVLNGVQDDAMILKNLYPTRPPFDDVVRNLKARHWSVYADPQPGWLGRPAEALFRTVPADRCLGSVDLVTDLGRLQGESYVEGWSWDVADRSAPVWQVLVDGSGTVRGLARSGWVRGDVQTVFPQTAGYATAWRGYVAAPPPLPDVHVYAVLADGISICPLSRPVQP